VSYSMTLLKSSRHSGCRPCRETERERDYCQISLSFNIT
jgi:hypothetical protein